MSTSDPNSAVSVAVSGPLTTTASTFAETPVIPDNSVIIALPAAPLHHHRHRVRSRQQLHHHFATSLPSPTVDNNEHKNARSQDEALVLVRNRKDEALALLRDRKVRITEGDSLYSLARSWMRNGLQESIQLKSSGMMKPLPKPLPVDTSLPNEQTEELTDEDEDEETVKELSDKELFKRHVSRAKKIRASLRQERLRLIERFKERIALVLSSLSDQSKNDWGRKSCIDV